MTRRSLISMPFITISVRLAFMFSSKLAHSAWTRSCLTPRCSAILSIMSISKPMMWLGSFGSPKTYGAPPPESAPHFMTPAFLIFASVSSPAVSESPQVVDVEVP